VISARLVQGRRSNANFRVTVIKLIHRKVTLISDWLGLGAVLAEKSIHKQQYY